VSDERGFEQLAEDLDRLEAITATWPAEHKATVEAIRRTLEAIQAGAFRSLIRTIKEEPGGLEALKKAVGDEWVRGVLTFHGLLRRPEPSPEERVEQALASVRPMLAQHAGDVHLVEIVDGVEVRIRLEGSCDGCTHSDITVRQGIETAIKEALPEVERVKVVDGRRGDALVQLPGVGSSPFARPWQDAGPADLAEHQLRAVELAKISVLVTMHEGEPRAYRNACAHLGMPLDDGKVEQGILTCAYHGFQFLMESGECITPPTVPLPKFPARIEGGLSVVQVIA